MEATIIWHQITFSSASTTSSGNLHHSQQRAGQAQRHWCLPALRRARARPSNSQRHPSRRVRPPCGFKSTRRQSLSTWFLLADCLRRSQGIGPKMQRGPEVQLQAALAGFCTQDHPHCLAFRSLGSRHGGTIQDSTRWLNSPTCRIGQVHQVGGSEAN